MSWLSQSAAYHDLTYRLGWILLHSVWQGVAAAVVLMIMLKVASRGSAATRYMLSLAMLLSVVAAGVVTGSVVHPPARAEPLISTAAIEAPAPTISLLQRGWSPASIVQNADAPVARSWNEAQILRGVVLAWLVGVFGLSLWQLGGWLMLRHHRRTSTPADPQLQASLARLASIMKINRSVGIAMSARLEIPLVLGVIRPIILVPISMLSELSPKQVEAILAHELAHVGRHDYLINLIQCAIGTLLFYHPAIWWISKQIRAEREFCCDELAAKACGDAADYGRALLALEECRSTSRLAPAAAGSGDLLHRVRRLMGIRNTKRITRARSWAIAATMMLACLITLASVRRSPAQATKPAAAPPPTSQETGYQDAANQIKNGDLIKVSILGLVQADVVSEIEKRVSDKGMINLPLVGDLQAAGLTSVQLAQAVSNIYRERKIIQDPRPSVKVVAPGVATRPSVDALPRSEITPEDLAAKKTDYLIGRNDVVKVTIVGLVSAETESTFQKRVSESGVISLPAVGEVSMIDLTEFQAEQAIVRAYRDKQLIQNARPSVTVIQATNRSFVIVGSVPGDVVQPGQYQPVDSDFRLLDALALARTSPGGLTILVIRKTDDPAKPRILEISGDRLVSGEAKVNVVVRPGDSIIVRKAVEPAAAGDPVPAARAVSEREVTLASLEQQIRTLSERLALARVQSIEMTAKYSPGHPEVGRAHRIEEALAGDLEQSIEKYGKLAGPRPVLGSSQRSSFLATQVEVLQSGLVMQKLQQMPEIVSLETFKSTEGDVTKYLRQNIDVALDRKTDLISISIRTSYADDAPKILNAIIQAYITTGGRAEILEPASSGQVKLLVGPAAASIEARGQTRN